MSEAAIETTSDWDLILKEYTLDEEDVNELTEYVAAKGFDREAPLYILKRLAEEWDEECWRSTTKPVAETPQPKVKRGASFWVINIFNLTVLVVAGYLLYFFIPGPGLTTPLLTAIGHRDVVQVKALLESGVEVNQKNKEGVAPLLMAAGYAPDSILEMLLAHGAQVEATDPDGVTPLMRASGSSHTSHIKILLQHRAMINAQDGRGETALMYAASNNQTESVRLLVENGADTSLMNQARRTALSLAPQSNEEISKILSVNVRP